MSRIYINFALLYKEPFLASADGFDSIILTLGCLSDFWRFSSLQDHRWNKQRECQPLHSYNCWLALSKSTEQGHGELHLWDTHIISIGNFYLIFGAQYIFLWSSENTTSHSTLLLERCHIIFLGALGLLPRTFTYKWNTDALGWENDLVSMLERLLLLVTLILIIIA